MLGIEPQTSGVGSDNFTNWATTTALPNQKLYNRSRPENQFFSLHVVIWEYSGNQKLQSPIAN